MFRIFPLRPAYGRDYKSIKELNEDWEADKEFITPNGQYTNKSDFEGMKEFSNIKEFSFRFCGDLKHAIIRRSY